MPDALNLTTFGMLALSLVMKTFANETFQHEYFFPDSVGKYKRSRQCFLFSLQNKDNLKPFKCPIYNHQNNKAIWCDYTCGAIFGSGHDLLISSDANTNQHSYTNLGRTYHPPRGYEPGTLETKDLLAGSYKFTPTEIEVFRCYTKVTKASCKRFASIYK